MTQVSDDFVSGTVNVYSTLDVCHPKNKTQLDKNRSKILLNAQNDTDDPSKS